MKKLDVSNMEKVQGGDFTWCYLSCLVECYWYGCSDPEMLCAYGCLSQTT